MTTEGAWREAARSIIADALHARDDLALTMHVCREMADDAEAELWEAGIITVPDGPEPYLPPSVVAVLGLPVPVGGLKALTDALAGAYGPGLRLRSVPGVLVIFRPEDDQGGES